MITSSFKLQNEEIELTFESQRQKKFFEKWVLPSIMIPKDGGINYITGISKYQIKNVISTVTFLKEFYKIEDVFWVSNFIGIDESDGCFGKMINEINPILVRLSQPCISTRFLKLVRNTKTISIQIILL